MIKPDEWILNQAEGYAELGLLSDAEEHLKALPKHLADAPRSLHVQYLILSKRNQWGEARKVAEILTQKDPDQAASWIFLAYATRRAENILAAREVLNSIVERFPEEPIIHFNLACYDSQLGQLDSARVHLSRFMRLVKNPLKPALDEPDLEPLWYDLEEIYKLVKLATKIP